MIATWTSTLYGLFKTLAGVTAPQKDIDVIMYQAATSKSVIRRFRSFKVYHVRADLVSKRTGQLTTSAERPGKESVVILKSFTVDFRVTHVSVQDYAVEIHAALSPQTPLIDAHSAAADLRHRLEKLPRVDSVLVVLEPDDEGQFMPPILSRPNAGSDAEKPRIAR